VARAPGGHLVRRPLMNKYTYLIMLAAYGVIVGIV
jgi:hypothetical protein